MKCCFTYQIDARSQDYSLISDLKVLVLEVMETDIFAAYQL